MDAAVGVEDLSLIHIFSEKYDIIRHPRYKYLSDADKKNTFDVDSYLSSLRRKKRRVITEDEPLSLIHIWINQILISL